MLLITGTREQHVTELLKLASRCLSCGTNALLQNVFDGKRDVLKGKPGKASASVLRRRPRIVRLRVERIGNDRIRLQKARYLRIVAAPLCIDEPYVIVAFVPREATTCHRIAGRQTITAPFWIARCAPRVKAAPIDFFARFTRNDVHGPQMVGMDKAPRFAFTAHEN